MDVLCRQRPPLWVLVKCTGEADSVYAQVLTVLFSGVKGFLSYSRRGLCLNVPFQNVETPGVISTFLLLCLPSDHVRHELQRYHSQTFRNKKTTETQEAYAQGPTPF